MNNLAHIMMIEFVQEICEKNYEFVALYNKNVLSEEDVLRLINCDEKHVGLLVIPKTQWEILFKNKGCENSELD